MILARGSLVDPSGHNFVSAHSRSGDGSTTQQASFAWPALWHAFHWSHLCLSDTPLPRNNVSGPGPDIYCRDLPWICCYCYRRHPFPRTSSRASSNPGFLSTTKVVGLAANPANPLHTLSPGPSLRNFRRASSNVYPALLAACIQHQCHVFLQLRIGSVVTNALALL
jgi:hypothetical protein